MSTCPPPKRFYVPGGTIAFTVVASCVISLILFHIESTFGDPPAAGPQTRLGIPVPRMLAAQSAQRPTRLTTHPPAIPSRKCLRLPPASDLGRSRSIEAILSSPPTSSLAPATARAVLMNPRPKMPATAAANGAATAAAKGASARWQPLAHTSLGTPTILPRTTSSPPHGRPLPIHQTVLAAQSRQEASAVADDDPTEYLIPGQVKNLHVGSDQTDAVRITRVEVADRNVCEAATIGTSKLNLIGTGLGTTQVDVWGEVSLPGIGPSEYRDRVTVTVLSEQMRTRFGNQLEVLERSIGKLYPESEVRIGVDGQGLVLNGQCASEEIANEIMDMVRKVCLVPIRQQLQFAPEASSLIIDGYSLGIPCSACPAEDNPAQPRSH